MFERIWSLAKAQSAIGSMKQSIVSRLDLDPFGLPAFAGLGGPAGARSKPVHSTLEQASDAEGALAGHPVQGPLATSASGGALKTKGIAGAEGPEAVFTYRSRLDQKALERARPRERDDLIEFEALMEFAISRGVRRQAVDLSYLDTPVSIELTAMLPSFGKALRELRNFAQGHGWLVVSMEYGDENGAVTRVAPPGATDFG